MCNNTMYTYMAWYLTVYYMYYILKSLALHHYDVILRKVTHVHVHAHRYKVDKHIDRVLAECPIAITRQAFICTLPFLFLYIK